VIIFDKFGDGQSERNRSVTLLPDNPTRIITLRAPFGMTNEGKMETSPQMGEGPSGSALPAPSASLTSDQTAVSVCGPRFAHHGTRLPISNRELDLLERPLSHCKQRKATVSNREHSTVCDSAGIATANSSQVSESPSSAAVSDPNSRKLTTFLTGSASQTEFVVTHSKQTTGEFLTGARTAIKVSQFRVEFRTESQPQRKSECRSRDAAEQGKIPLHIRNEKELS
jgi:hypothetical protein